MNRPQLVLLASSIALAVSSTSAVAQGTIVSTRTLNGEVFDLTDAFTSGEGQFTLSMGLEDLFAGNGTPSLVEIDLRLTWDIDLSLTNNESIRGRFEYQTPVDLVPVTRDCSAYQSTGLFAFTSEVDPGDVASLVISETDTFGFTGSQFDTACGAAWDWNEAFIWTSIQSSSTARLRGPFGGPVPASSVQVNVASVSATGTVRVTWAPTPLTFQSVCPGTESPSVLLEPAGGLQFMPDVYFFQTGAPASTNLLARSDNATSTVNPISGLCLTGSVVRVPGTLNQGGAPLRLPSVIALSGSVTYFQSWFRTAGVGTSGTSECIAVQFP